jgi:hypothetical protein
MMVLNSHDTSVIFRLHVRSCMEREYPFVTDESMVVSQSRRGSCRCCCGLLARARCIIVGAVHQINKWWLYNGFLHHSHKNAFFFIKWHVFFFNHCHHEAVPPCRGRQWNHTPMPREWRASPWTHFRPSSALNRSNIETWETPPQESKGRHDENNNY